MSNNIICSDNNDWNEISKRSDLSEHDLRKYKDLLNWELVIHYNEDISNDLLDELITEGKININFGYSANMEISMCHANDPKFIKKYCEQLSMPFVAKRNKIKYSDYITMINKPEIGQGVTQHLNRHFYPFTIIFVSKKGNRIRIQEDTAKLTGEFDKSSHPVYSFEKNEQGKIYELKLTKKFRWEVANQMEVFKELAVFKIGFRKRYERPEIKKRDN